MTNAKSRKRASFDVEKYLHTAGWREKSRITARDRLFSRKASKASLFSIFKRVE